MHELTKKQLIGLATHRFFLTPRAVNDLDKANTSYLKDKATQYRKCTTAANADYFDYLFGIKEESFEDKVVDSINHWDMKNISVRQMAIDIAVFTKQHFEDHPEELNQPGSYGLCGGVPGE